LGVTYKVSGSRFQVPGKDLKRRFQVSGLKFQEKQKKASQKGLFFIVVFPGT